MSVPTTTSTIPILAQVSESVIPAPVAMTSASSYSGCTLDSTDNQFVRDSDQITASEAMLVIKEGPRVPQSSVPLNVVPETQEEVTDYTR